jgi:hypothetical protein
MLTIVSLSYGDYLVSDIVGTISLTGLCRVMWEALYDLTVNGGSRANGLDQPADIVFPALQIVEEA